MKNRKLLTLLLLSLSLNLAVVTGYLYQRHIAVERSQLSAVTQRLQLSGEEQAALRRMRRSVFDSVAALRKERAAANAALRRLVAERPLDDPALAEALARIADERAQIQQHAIARLIDFRDGLRPQARERFARAMEEKGFLLALFGVSNWGLPQGEATK